MRYNTSVLSETVTILGRFQSGRTAAQVTVALFNAATGASIPVTSPNTAEIGTTGVYRFSTSQITTQPTAFTEILYIMTDTITNRTHDGKIVLGGHVDNLDATVSSRGTADPGDAMDLVAGAVDAAAIATDAIDGDAIAASAVTEIQAGLATAAALAAVDGKLPATLNAGRMRSHVEAIDAGLITPTVAPNLDVAVSSRAAPGAAMDLVTDAVDAGALAASGLAEIAFVAWDEVLTGATHNITNSAGKRLRQLADQGIVAEGTAQAGAAATITLDAGDTRPTDFYRDMLLGITEGTGAGQIRLILAYNGGTKVATPHRAWEVIPDATSKYVIGLLGASAILSDATRIPGGFIDAAISSRSTGASAVVATTTAAAGSTSTEVRTPLTQADGFFDGATILVINAAGTAVRDVLRHLNANGAFTLEEALPFTPSVSDVVLVLASRGAKTGGVR
jgi:hypothetical protein